MFSDGRNSTTFDRMGICCDLDTGAWNRTWTGAEMCRAAITVLVCCLDMPFVRHTDEIAYVCALCWMLSGAGGDWSSME